ncbi:MAG: Gfo/Idh/MocA family oxidoreductase [Methanobacteriota archaeon]|nr:MAG: Gfo/Idh/MocA family oxidoreductase [Euryarchaeota archaeon]
MDRLRVGVIGLGHVAQVCHLPGMAMSKHVDVVAGAELQEDILQNVCARWDLSPYRDYETMLREEALDIACVLTGPKHSAAVASSVADAGVNVLIEKPMALRMEEAEAISDRCRERGVQLFYGESFRFFPTLRKAKDILDSGAVGELRLLLETVVLGRGAREFEEYGIYPEGAPGSGPMGLTDHGIHMVDVFRWLSGLELSWVVGRGNRAGSPPLTEFMTIGTEEGAIAQFVGDEATVSSSLPGEGIQCPTPYEGEGPAWDPSPISFRIHCSEGALRAFPYANKLYLFGREGHEEIEAQDCPHPGQFGLQIDSFARSLVDHDEPEITSRDGIAALRAILGAYDSFESSTVVRL